MTFTTIQAPAPPSDDIYVAAHAQPMSAGFRVRPIVSAKMIRATLSGFWSRDMLNDFAGEMGRGLAALGTASNEHLVLCDISRTPIQSQAVYDGFREILDEPASHPRRLALVVGQSAGRMQARRLLVGRDDARIFECEN